jgi:hypothetical protein
VYDYVRAKHHKIDQVTSLTYRTGIYLAFFLCCYQFTTHHSKLLQPNEILRFEALCKFCSRAIHEPVCRPYMVQQLDRWLDRSRKPFRGRSATTEWKCWHVWRGQAYVKTGIHALTPVTCMLAEDHFKNKTCMQRKSESGNSQNPESSSWGQSKSHISA